MTDIKALITKKYLHEVWNRFIKAISEYSLIEDGDRILVGISGGKDSFLLALLLKLASEYKIYDIKLCFALVDDGGYEESIDTIKENCKKLSIDLQQISSRPAENSNADEASPCFWCARQRRGALLAYAEKTGCNKLALGHHYDDVIETTLMSMLYGSQLSTMLPFVESENFGQIGIIRPMYLIEEKDIINITSEFEMDFSECRCALLKQKDRKSTRLKVKKLIEELSEENPAVRGNIFGSLKNVDVKKLFSYRENGRFHSNAGKEKDEQ